MSDGNFNRSLLPHTPYHSGLQTGKSMARMQAVEVFRQLLSEELPGLSADEAETLTAHFKARLSRKI